MLTALLPHPSFLKLKSHRHMSLYSLFDNTRYFIVIVYIISCHDHYCCSISCISALRCKIRPHAHCDNSHQRHLLALPGATCLVGDIRYKSDSRLSFQHERYASVATKPMAAKISEAVRSIGSIFGSALRTDDKDESVVSSLRPETVRFWFVD